MKVYVLIRDDGYDTGQTVLAVFTSKEAALAKQASLPPLKPYQDYYILDFELET